MKLKKAVDFSLDFHGKWAQWSAGLMGAFLFLRAVYYFAWVNISDCGSGELWLQLIVPMILGIGFIVLLWGVRLNMPVMYAGLGVAYCVLLIIWGVQSGSMARGIIGLVWYFLAAGVLMITVLGYLPNRLYLVLAFGLPVLFRFFVYDVKSYLLDLQLIVFLPELSVLCGLGALCCFVPCLKAQKCGCAQK